MIWSWENSLFYTSIARKTRYNNTSDNKRFQFFSPGIYCILPTDICWCSYILRARTNNSTRSDFNLYSSIHSYPTKNKRNYIHRNILQTSLSNIHSYFIYKSSAVNQLLSHIRSSQSIVLVFGMRRKGNVKEINPASTTKYDLTDLGKNKPARYTDVHI
jgi:hypothetical protein